MQIEPDSPSLTVLDLPDAGGKAIRGGVIRSGASIAAMLMSLLAVPFMTRHLGEVNYGYYTTVVSLLFILVGLTEAGLTALGIREYAVRSGSARDRLMASLVGLRLVITLTGIVLAVAFTVVTGRPEPIIVGTAIVGFSMLLTLTQQTYSIPLTAELRLGWVSGLELIRQFVLSGGAVLMVVLGAGLTSFFWVTVAAGATVLAVTLLVVRNQAWLRPRFDREQWLSIAKQTVAYSLAAAVGLIYFRMAILLLGFVADDREVGIYGAAFKIIETLGTVPFMLAASAFPILARAASTDRARLRFASSKMLQMAIVAGVPLGIGLMIAAPFAVSVIGGPKFADSVVPLQIHAMGMLTTFIVGTGSLVLLAVERFRELLTANLIAAAVSAGLTIWLGAKYAAEGAAIATFSAECVLAAGYLIYMAKEDSGLLPPVSAVVRTLPGAAAMLAVWLLVPTPPLLTSAIAGALFVPIAFACGAVPRELTDALLRRSPTTGPTDD